MPELNQENIELLPFSPHCAEQRLSQGAAGLMTLGPVQAGGGTVQRSTCTPVAGTQPAGQETPRVPGQLGLPSACGADLVAGAAALLRRRRDAGRPLSCCHAEGRLQWPTRGPLGRLSAAAGPIDA